VRGVTAMGFSALMLDRYGFPSDAATQLRELGHLLGSPIATRGDRLVAWDLRPARTSLLRNMSAASQRALAQQLLDAPRLYLATDVDTLTGRGDRHAVCETGTLSLVNPGHRAVRRQLEISFAKRRSAARRGYVTVDGRSMPITADRHFDVPIDVRPGTTTITISVDTPGVRCESVPLDSLPSVSAALHPVLAST
ncbi:MAG: hypothetical protein QOI55_1171, partial [Actinomycetota bacterium]|nr:hypothetical protein [Actinomycetota bacterium]